MFDGDVSRGVKYRGHIISVILKEQNFGIDYFKDLLKERKKSNTSAFEQIMQKQNGKGLFWGFKMYTRLGYAPDDFKRFPQLADFYTNCVTHNIPIICHCSPGGMGIADQYIYFKEAAAQHKREPDPNVKEFWDIKDNEVKSRWNRDKFLWIDWDKDKDFKPFSNERTDIMKRCLPNGIRYIDEACVRPANWRNVLHDYKNLKLCLAHFGGVDFWKEYGDEIKPEKKWNDFRGEIIDLIGTGPNVYTDISCFTDKDDSYYIYKALPKFLNDFPALKLRVMLGTDWYMTVLDMSTLSDYQHHMFRLMQEVSDKVGYDAFYQFGVINPLRYLGIIDDFNNVNVVRLENYRDYIVEKINNTTWQNKKLNTILNSTAIKEATMKANSIYSLLSKVAIETSDSTERKERIKKA